MTDKAPQGVVSPRARLGLLVSLTAASGVLALTGIVAGIARPDDSLGPGSNVLSLLSWGVLVGAFSGVGGLIARRRSENPIGWLLSLIGLLEALGFAAGAIGSWGIETGALSARAAGWVEVVAVAGVLAVALTGTQLPLLLPDGHPLSPRWRTFSRLSVGLVVVAGVATLLQPKTVDELPGVANPLGVEGGDAFGAVFFLVILSFFGAVASLVLRYRRARSHDRVQLRWIGLGGVAFLITFVLALILIAVTDSANDPNSLAGLVAEPLFQLAFAALPMSIGIAILRHRLYDIDVVINRTLVYGALTATLAGVYLGSVLLLQLVLSGLTKDSSLAIAASTLGVAALFRPARTRIQEVVDRRFFRRKYDAQRTLEDFSSRLRDEVDLGALNAELRAVVADTMQPAHVSLWLRASQERP